MKSSVVVIDYGSGNLRSVAKAFEYVAGQVKVTSDANALKNASHIVLPGVGAFGDCMKGLSEIPGMLDALNEQVISQSKWFLGVCVGMQMLFERGHEHGLHEGLGWLKGEVVSLRGAEGDVAIQQKPHGSDIESTRPQTRHAGLLRSARNDDILKIPHMGWNDLHIDQPHALLSGIENGEHAYFVHSYYAKLSNNETLLASASYGVQIPAVVGKNNLFGTQFHPEKSQKTGLRLLENFVKL